MQLAQALKHFLGRELLRRLSRLGRPFYPRKSLFQLLRFKLGSVRCLLEKLLDSGHAGDGLPDRDAEHGQEAEVLEHAALALARVARGVAGNVGEATGDPDETGGGGEARVVQARVEEAAGLDFRSAGQFPRGRQARVGRRVWVDSRGQEDGQVLEGVVVRTLGAV